MSYSRSARLLHGQSHYPVLRCVVCVTHHRNSVFAAMVALSEANDLNVICSHGAILTVGLF